MYHQATTKKCGVIMKYVVKMEKKNFLRDFLVCAA